MKKYIAHILLIPLTILALTPPWQFAIKATLNSMGWMWAVFFSGFLAFLFLHFKTNVWLKLFIVWCFISNFLSSAPYISFTMFWSVIACAYYYLACTKIADFKPVEKVIQSIFFFIVLLIIMQGFGKDTLLNFGIKEAVVLGTIGNRMMLASFVCVLSPFLIHRPLNWIPIFLVALISGSSGIVLSVTAGLGYLLFRTYRKLRILIVAVALLIPLLFAYKTGDVYAFTRAGRGPVWLKTIELIGDRPLGYGIACYKILFPHLCGTAIRDESGVGKQWGRAHNDFLQIPFEVGIPGFILLLGFLGTIAWRTKDVIKRTGLIILGTNMCVAFPMRMTQSVLILIMFLAYCNNKVEV